jgi:hypothetical protein
VGRHNRTRHSVARLSKTPPQLLYRVAMNIKMSSGNVLCQSGLEHSNSTNTLIFCSILSDLTVSEVQVKMHVYVVQAGLAQNIAARHFDIHRNTIQ